METISVGWFIFCSTFCQKFKKKIFKKCLMKINGKQILVIRSLYNNFNRIKKNIEN